MILPTDRGVTCLDLLRPFRVRFAVIRCELISREPSGTQETPTVSLRRWHGTNLNSKRGIFGTTRSAPANVKAKNQPPKGTDMEDIETLDKTLDGGGRSAAFCSRGPGQASDVEIVPRKVAMMADVLERQMRGERIAIVGGGQRWGKTMAMRIAMAASAQPMPLVIVDSKPNAEL
eukprot:GHVR01099706.1.p1 GENE.GHVR01099706.1~~GHVR01099706.1.p1  ORF type:complete len:175 (-),score=13.66 GHVR01099706.1:472-996(-)